jgi:Ca2+-binding RTX toxin-like protein
MRRHDTIKGSKGNDRIAGDEGNDILTGDSGDDLFDCGDGNDRITDIHTQQEKSMILNNIVLCI